MSPPTVLVVGATGNIGVSAVQAALKLGYHVLAIVRNQKSAEKLFDAVKTKDGITTVEADITSDTGVQSVVDQVKSGKLPDFQHVYACAGGLYGETRMTNLSTAEFKEYMNINFESNFYAYRATIPYLLSQNGPTTWTLCTGALGDLGVRPAPALTQGALFSMANAAFFETADTNVRFNEVYLSFRVEVDAIAEKNGVVKASEFAKVYEQILQRDEIKGSRVIVNRPEEMETLNVEKKRLVPYGM